MKQFNTEFIRKEERGELIQVSTGDWKQLNILKIKKDNTFGRHYHKNKKELFYILSGKVYLGIKNMKTDTFEKHCYSEGEVFLVEEYDHHTLFAYEDTVIIELLSQPYTKEDSYET